MAALEQGRVAPRDLSAFTARQLLALKMPQVDATLGKVWGMVRPASQEKAHLLAKYKAPSADASAALGEAAQPHSPDPDA